MSETDAAQEQLRAAVPAFQQLEALHKPKVDTFDIGQMVREVETRANNPVEEEEDEIVPDEVVEETPVEQVEEVPNGSLDTPLGKVDLAKGEKPNVEVQEEVEEPEPELPPSQKKAKAEFVRLHKENRAQKKELADLPKIKEELEQLRSRKPEVKLDEIPEYTAAQQQLQQAREELEKHKAELNEARKVVAIADFKKTPEYENGVVKPWRDSILPSINEIAKEKGIDPETIKSLIQTRDQTQRKARFNEIVSGAELDTYDQQRLIKAINDYDSLAERHKFLEDNAIKAQEMTEGERKAKAQQDEKAYRDTLTNNIRAFRTQAQSKLPEFVREDPAFKEAISKIDPIIDQADWYSVPVEKQAQLLEIAMKAPLVNQLQSIKYQKDISERDEKIKTLEGEKTELEKSIKKLSKATPSAGSGGGAPKLVDQPNEYVVGKNAPNIGDSIGALVGRR
jgi:hypothetical protein